MANGHHLLTKLQTARLLNTLEDWDNIFKGKIKFFARHCNQTLKPIFNGKAELFALECPDCFTVFQLFEPTHLEDIVARARAKN